jgi:hypothetical protein
MLTCNSLRTSVAVSALLLVFGLVLELAAEAKIFSVATGYLGFFALLAAAGVLGVTLMMSLLPGTSKRLSECQH